MRHDSDDSDARPTSVDAVCQTAVVRSIVGAV
jgi:hypothetical protein